MGTYLCININNSVKKYEGKDTTEANKSYIRAYGKYFIVTSNNTTGPGIKVIVDGKSCKVADTKQITVTTNTGYLTRASTSGTGYNTRASTSATTYATRSSTSATTYATRASTSGTGYNTRASTYGTGYYSRASTSATTYATRQSQYQTYSTSSAYNNMNRIQFTYVVNTSHDKVRERITYNTVKQSGNCVSLLRSAYNGNASTTYTANTSFTNSTAASEYGYELLFPYAIYTATNGSPSKKMDPAVYLNNDGASTVNLPNHLNKYGMVARTTSKRTGTGVVSMTFDIDYATTTNVMTDYYNTTRASISATGYLTRASTYSTTYATRASTYSTTYATRASTSATGYNTRASTSATGYNTRASTSATTYATRASTYSTTYATTTSSAFV